MRLDTIWTKVTADVHELAQHSPDSHAALHRLTRPRKRHSSAGLTDTLLLNAVEDALKEAGKPGKPGSGAS